MFAKYRLRSKVNASIHSSTILLILLGMLLTSICAAGGAKLEQITIEDYKKITGIISKNRCDIEKFQREATRNNIKIKILDLETSDESSDLSVLSNDDLCLISLGSSFQAYGERVNDTTSAIIAARNVFPENKKVVRIEFYLPKTLTPKKCSSDDQVTYPYVLMFNKFNGELVGTIYETDTPSECFVMTIKKMGKI